MLCFYELHFLIFAWNPNPNIFSDIFTLSQPRHLPTSRIIHSSGPLVPPNTLQQRLTPLLFESSRLLSIVPAVFGTLYNLYRVYNPPNPNILIQSGNRRPPERVDFFVSALWVSLLLEPAFFLVLITKFQPTLGYSYRLPMPPFNDGPSHPLETLLSSPPHSHPFNCFTSNMLARNPFYVINLGTPQKASDCLGCCGDNNQC